MKRIKRFLCVVLASVMLLSAPVVSYMEAEAAQLVGVLGGVAIGEILKDLLIAAGVTSLGALTIHEVKKDSEAFESLKSAVLSSGLSETALEDLESYKNANSSQELSTLNYTSAAGYKLSGVSGKLNITLSKSLVDSARDAARKWADSAANEVTVAESAEQSGTEYVSSEYMNSIQTTVLTIPSVSSMSDIDSFFSVDGAYNYLISRGYSDSDYYFLVYAGGVLTYIMPVPMGYSVVGYRTSWAGATGVRIISNINYRNAILQNGVRDSVSFYNYFSSLPVYNGKYYVYNHSSDLWSVTEGNYLPGHDTLSGKLSFSNWYTCNYQAAYSKGASITWNSFGTDLVKKLYTYKTVAKNIVYDLSLAPSIPDDGLTFEIPESDYSGFAYPDLSVLIEYITSLTDQLEKWHEETAENQEEIIKQNKSIIEGLNSIHQTLHTVSINVGKSVTAVLSILDAVLSLPEDIAAALGESFSIPGVDLLIEAVDLLPGVLVDEFAAVLPDVITDAVADSVDSLPEDIAAALGDVAIDIPAIEIPEIVVPEIVVPEIALPDVILTLNPDYDITVANDYDGLDGVISGAVEGVLTDLFVPDEAVTTEKVAAMQAYFEFKDDIIGAFEDLKTMIFGITPSPILKIPVGAVNSDYDYGIGSYIIIDVGWYAPYKQFGDKVILAICWAFFIWRLYIKLPGIISGMEGSIVATDKAYNRYNLRGD